MTDATRQSRVSITGIVANLACGAFGSRTATVAALAWLATTAVTDHDLLLLQECPADAASAVAPTHDVFAYAGPEPGYRCRSIVAVRRDAGLAATATTITNADYHRTYLAACEVTLPIGPTVVASVHASPTRLTDADLRQWYGELPPPRPCAPGDELWDADLVMDTLRRSVGTTHLLAGGDLNEARGSDEHFGKPWGEELFAHAEAAGLVDVTFSLWGGERPTARRPDGGGAWQLDHLFATPAAADKVDGSEVLGDGHEAAMPWSDHDPIRFTIAPSPRRASPLPAGN